MLSGKTDRQSVQMRNEAEQTTLNTFMLFTIEEYFDRDFDCKMFGLKEKPWLIAGDRFILEISVDEYKRGVAK